MTSPVDFSTGDIIFGALQVTKVLSTEEAKRAIEGSGKDFGKSMLSSIYSWSGIQVPIRKFQNFFASFREINHIYGHS